MKKINSTLLILIKENEILLAKKKRGFGEGKFNGVGGKIEGNETPEEAMIRECQEEIFVTPTRYEKIGENKFLEYIKDEKVELVFHLFVATEWEGEPKESEEMSPQWFKLQDIPYNEMFEDDKYWLPHLLAGKKFDGTFEFDKDWNLLKYEINETGTWQI